MRTNTRFPIVCIIIADFLKFSLVLYYALHFLLLVSRPSSVSGSYALKDEPIPPGGASPTKDLGSDWLILRKRLTWGDASVECDHLHYRLAMLPDHDKTKELVQLIREMSVPYTAEYDKAYKQHEFGMDRRYWIGLTDQLEEGKWMWTHNGSALNFDFWYPSQPDHLVNSTGKPINSTKEHCVSLWNPGYHVNNSHSFNDEICNSLYYAICDKKVPSGSASAGAQAPAADPGTPPPPPPPPPPAGKKRISIPKGGGGGAPGDCGPRGCPGKG